MMSNTKDESIVVVDLDVDLNELPEVEIVSLDEDDTETMTLKSCALMLLRSTRTV